MTKTLFRKARPGNSVEAEIVEEHLSLVRDVVRRVAAGVPPQIEMGDLYSHGLLGILNAVRGYKPNAGSSFESYARIRIRGTILDELRNQDWIPRSIHDKARALTKAIIALEQKLGRTASHKEIAASLKISPKKLEKLRNKLQPPLFIHLDSLVFTDEDIDTFHEIIDDKQENPYEATERRELCGIVADSLENLPEKPQKVLILYYFEDLKFEQIGLVFSVTAPRITQIHKEGIEILRDKFRKLDIPVGI